jgi:hypothetical protein
MSATMDKIAALLALAERTDNEHEAELAMSQAQRLATLNTVDLAVARQHTAKKEKREEIESRSVRIGERGAKGNKQLVELFSAIAEQNNVQILIARNSTHVFPMGFPSDLDVVEAMYTSLAVQMTVAGNVFLRKGEYKQETTLRWVKVAHEYTEWSDYWGSEVKRVRYTEELVTKPLDGRQARAEFNRGFTNRIGARLRTAREEAEKQVAGVALTVDDEETGAVTETTGALVLADKKAKVNDAFQAKLKKDKIRGSWKGSKSGGHSPISRSAGRDAGDSARFRGETAIGGSQREVTA